MKPEREVGLVRALPAWIWAALCLWAWPLTTLAQAQAPVDAGRLLQEQRRLEQQRDEPARPAAAPLSAPTLPLKLSPSVADTLFTVNSFSLSGNTAVDDAVLQAALQPWLGRQLSLADLRAAAAQLEQVYRDAGWLMQVTLPPQDVTDGVVRLLIVEARFGKLVLQDRGDAEPQVAAGLLRQVQALVRGRLVEGRPLDLRALERALLMADEVPGVRVAGSLRAGSVPGSTDVLLELSPAPRTSAELILDNGANRATGEARASAIVTVNSPLGQGDRLDLLLSASRGTQYLRGAASVPLGGSGLRVGVHASGLGYRVLDSRNTTTGLAPEGSGATAGLDAQLPLIRSAQDRWDARAGIERTRQVNRDDNVTLGERATTSRSRTTALNLALIGQRLDAIGGGGQMQASAQLTAGRLSLAGSPESLLQGDSRTAGTAGSYRKLRVGLSRLQALTPALSLQAAFSGQVASRNLDPSEKFYLGGAGAVNAYPSGEAAGSNGALVNLELRQQLQAQWQLSGLLDWGRVQQFQDNRRADGGGPLVAHNDVTLKGYGASLVWRPGNATRAGVTWARRIGSNPLATPAGSDTDGSHHKNRIWLNASVAF